eukprot:evm.model.NODE_31818_length_9830_cov_14.565819.1
MVVKTKRTAMLVVVSKTRMMRSSWVVVAVFDARHILAANSRTATMMQFNLSHVESQARAGAVAETEAGAGGEGPRETGMARCRHQ